MRNGTGALSATRSSLALTPGYRTLVAKLCAPAAARKKVALAALSARSHQCEPIGNLRENPMSMRLE
jgi:hypothetical protein